MNGMAAADEDEEDEDELTAELRLVPADEAAGEGGVDMLLPISNSGLPNSQEQKQLTAQLWLGPADEAAGEG
jgi:hypothetical protein